MPHSGAAEEVGHGHFDLTGAASADPCGDLPPQRGLKITHALVCAMLGFFLAGTSMAPTIQNGLTATADVVSSLKP